MKKQNFKQNHKAQQNRNPKIEAIPFMAEITVPTEEDFVTIPITEYIGLIANNALLDAAKRVIEADTYSNHTTLRSVLGMPKKEEK